jgi:hypothetical protein
VFSALLFCSDGDCAEVFGAYGSLEELEALACDCGCSLELLGLSEARNGEAIRGFELAPFR